MSTSVIQNSQIEAIRSGLTLSHFRSWIKNHPYPEQIGIPGNSTACPIAMFLLKTFGLSDEVYVSNHVIEQIKTSVIFFCNSPAHSIVCFHNCTNVNYSPSSAPRLPAWVVKFIHMSDKLEFRVTAIQALNILDEIEKEAKQLALV